MNGEAALMDEDGFWVILVYCPEESSMPNPAGFFLAVPTLEMAKRAVYDEVNHRYPNRDAPELEWKQIERYSGWNAVTAWHDVWTVWPAIMTVL